MVATGLNLEIAAEERKFAKADLAAGHLFSDARSTPPRIAAVLFLYAFKHVARRQVARVVSRRDGKSYYCDMEPPGHLLRSFRPRNGDQIMCLEMLSIALGKFAGCVVWGMRARVLCGQCRIVHLCKPYQRAQHSSLERQHCSRGGSKERYGQGV